MGLSNTLEGENRRPKSKGVIRVHGPGGDSDEGRDLRFRNTRERFRTIDLGSKGFTPSGPEGNRCDYNLFPSKTN